MTKTLRQSFAVERAFARWLAAGATSTDVKRSMLGFLATRLRLSHATAWCLSGFAPGGRLLVLDQAEYAAASGTPGRIPLPTQVPEGVRAHWGPLDPLLCTLAETAGRLSVATLERLPSPADPNTQVGLRTEPVGSAGSRTYAAGGPGAVLVGFFRMRQPAGHADPLGESRRVEDDRTLGMRPLRPRREDDGAEVLGVVLQLGRPAGAAAFTPDEAWLVRRVLLRMRRLASQCGLPLYPQQRQPLGLSVRQTQVLHHLLGGCSTKEAAAKLGISALTVSGYVKDIYRHYRVHSRSELLSRFIERSRRPWA
ncbi:MAG: response regulator transcription factor [Tepidisphaerales bacterium]